MSSNSVQLAVNILLIFYSRVGNFIRLQNEFQIFLFCLFSLILKLCLWGSVALLCIVLPENLVRMQ